MGSLKEQPMLLMSEPSLQSRQLFLQLIIGKCVMYTLPNKVSYTTVTGSLLQDHCLTKST